MSNGPTRPAIASSLSAAFAAQFLLEKHLLDAAQVQAAMLQQHISDTDARSIDVTGTAFSLNHQRLHHLPGIDETQADRDLAKQRAA